MCGIVWFIGSVNNTIKNKIDQWMQAIINRGKSRTDIEDKNLYAKYWRLPTSWVWVSIKDLRIHDDTTLLYNWIIYNHRELAELYEVKEYINDTDLLKQILDNKRDTIESIVSSLRWMFAIVYYSDWKLFLVRDTVWVKPLYYSIWKSWLAFWSEKKSLVWFEKTIYEVLPWQIVSYSLDKKDIHKSSFEFAKPVLENETLCSLLIDAVVTPTIDYLNETENKSIGLLLSWWLDSSLLLQLLANHLPEKMTKRVRCYALWVEWSEDVTNAQLLANTLGFSLKHISVDESLLIQNIISITHLVESPSARVVRVWILLECLAKAIRDDDIDVVISGEWADELFYWYQRFNDISDIPEMLDICYNLFLKKIFYNSLLERLDRVFSSYTIESRVPFCDQKIVGFAASLSAHEKIVGWFEKYPLRKLGEEIGLLDQITRRKKMKLTVWATKKWNTNTSWWLFEQWTKELFWKSFWTLCEENYIKNYSKDGVILSAFVTDEKKLFESFPWYVFY